MKEKGNIQKNMYWLRYYNKQNKFFSQKEISQLLKIPQTQISRIENGAEPRLYDVIAYAIFFKISTDDLIFKKYNIETKEFEIIQSWINCSKFVDELTTNRKMI